jgi:uncharacterized membrane protein
MYLLLQFYFVLCILIGAVLVSIFAYEDIAIGKGHNNKYNFKTPFSWGIVICATMPVVNVLIMILFSYLIYTRNIREYKQNLFQDESTN